MHSIKKTLLDKFQEHLEEAYTSHCRQHDQVINQQGLLNYLIDQGLIPLPQIRRFTVSKEFNQQFLAPKSKTQTIRKLSDFFNISERHIWGILKYNEQLRKK